MQEYCPDADSILDIGCGTGANLRMVRDIEIGTITGIDASPLAIKHCRDKAFKETLVGDICALPYSDMSFDIVLATDVIEHVADDLAAVSEIFRVLRPGGKAIFTVPAFQSLWGLQDDLSHHYRRYRMAPFCALLETAGLTISLRFHFNYFLFLPIWTTRQLLRLTKISFRSENDLNTPLLNCLLSFIFKFDVASARWLRPPFGVSICAVVSKH